MSGDFNFTQVLLNNTQTQTFTPYEHSRLAKQYAQKGQNVMDKNTAGTSQSDL